MSAKLPHRLLSALLLACLAWLAAAVGLAAQEGQVELRSSADYVYGQSMNFHLTAANIGTVDTVTLFIRLGASPDSFAVEMPVEPEEQPIEVSYALDLSQTRLPPFGAITYWWELSGDEGTPVRVPEQVISYVDDQFSWRQVVVTDETGGGNLRILWTGDSGTLGEQAREIIFEMVPEIGRLIPIAHIIPFDVYIYPSTSDLGAALRLAGREFEPGQTYPDLGVVLATVVNPETAEAELRSGLSRGLVDLLLFQLLNQRAHNLPPWLARGLAGQVRGQTDRLLEDTLRAAISADGTIPVAELCDGAPVDNDLALAQSESLVAYIVDNYGEEAVRTLVTEFAAGAECSAALRKATQLTPGQLESAWLRANNSNQGARALAEVAMWLVLVLAGFGLAGLLLLRPGRRG